MSDADARCRAEKKVLPYTLVKIGSLCDREVACSVSDHQVWILDYVSSVIYYIFYYIFDELNVCTYILPTKLLSHAGV